MKKTSKVLSFILGAAMAVGALPSISASADYRYYPMEDVDIRGHIPKYEYFNDTELYKNHKEYFPRAIVHRCLNDSDFFFGYSHIFIHRLRLTFTNDKWEEIYNKYEDELGLEIAYTEENAVCMKYDIDLSSCKSNEESQALINKQAVIMQEKYETIMNMCSEMYEAGCITEAEYMPLDYAQGDYMQTENIFIKDFGNIATEEVEDVINSVTDNMRLVHSVHDYFEDDGTHINYSTDYIRFIDYEKGTAEDYFAVIDALKEKFGDELIIPVPDTVNPMEIGWAYPAFFDNLIYIDIIEELKNGAGIAYGDANIDDHIGIQDAIVMNKSIVGAVELNEEQKKVVDLNKDNDVNSEDLNLLLRYLVDDVDTLRVKK